MSSSAVKKDLNTGQNLLGPPAPFTTVNGENMIAPGTTFTSNQNWVTSQNQEYVLILQDDGNLVVYQVVGNPPPFQQGSVFTGQPIWATGTDGNPGDNFAVQNDGNLVIYAQNGNVLWSPNTYNTTPVGLFMQNDGNLVLYKSVPSWDSKG